MYLAIAKKPSLYEGLRRIDEDLAATTREAGCPHCGGALHTAAYDRKPRGMELPDAYARRQGLCCGRCRRRTLPPSALFLGRRVYLAAVLLIAVTVWKGRLEGATASRLRTLFGVTHSTLRRWRTFFERQLPTSTTWKRLRGLLGAAVRDDALPGALLAALGSRDDPAASVHQALVLLATG